jgi:RNA polymerase sigma-70 factor (ECF subfamily)
MLGSAADADDALQEALLRAWRGLRRFEGRSSLRTWLYMIATNSCLKMLSRHDKRFLPVDYGPSVGPEGSPGQAVEGSLWVEPHLGLGAEPLDARPSPEARYDERESVELAFIAALQHLPARQRAALVLHDVLGFPGEEVATMLGSTVASVYSALQRAHKAVDDRLSPPSQQVVLREYGKDKLCRLAGAYVEAWERADVNALVKLPTEDVVLSMPPLPGWYEGRENVAQFLRRSPFRAGGRWRLVETRANGQLAFANYLWDASAGRFMPHSVDLLSLSGAGVKEITAFLLPERFPGFGLAPQLEPAGP